ncbi:MAG: hypothetical protein EOM25_08755 [Deltaproteobacteria bacterium]|nr:hypothetical protein [Deltaproteobacteria bacterium]
MPDIAEHISKAKDRLANHNVLHVRELIRYLPENRFQLFHLVPLLLHFNDPRLPGWVDHPLACCGVYRLEETGFWATGLDLLEIDAEDLGRPLLPRPCILGLYLMGSIGTLGQGADSDFDYWVLVDESMKSSIQHRLLRQKLGAVERWAEDEYGQPCRFYVLTPSDLRANRFTDARDRGFGLGMGTILKEEFYRTFLFLCGKIPIWALAGDSLPYAEIVSAMDESEDLRSLYVDLGDLETVDRREISTATLWQAYKAATHPAKALIKACFIAGLPGPGSPLPCHLARKGFGGPSEDTGSDPYGLLLSSALDFAEKSGDVTLLEDMRQAVFLKVCDCPDTGLPLSGSPKEAFLRDLTAAWNWASALSLQLAAYSRWPERQRILFERHVAQTIARLSTKLSKDFRPEPDRMRLENLMRRELGWMHRHGPDAIPLASATLRQKAREMSFIVGRSPSGGWAVFTRIGRDFDPAFLSPGPLACLAWIARNDLIRPGRSLEFSLTSKEVSLARSLAGTFPRIRETLGSDENSGRGGVRVVVLLGPEVCEFVLRYGRWFWARGLLRVEPGRNTGALARDILEAQPEVGRKFDAGSDPVIKVRALPGFADPAMAPALASTLNVALADQDHTGYAGPDGPNQPEPSFLDLW